MYYAQRFPHIGRLVLAGGRDLVGRKHQVPVPVQVADDGLRRVPHRLGQGDQGKLRMQMIAERDRGGEKRLKRRLFDVFRSRTLVAGIEILVKVGAKIDFVEGIRGGFRVRQLGRFRRHAIG
jgi:hypothetical protein